MPQTVHLEGIRCDGNAHGGCQAACLIFWKDAWLKGLGDSDDLGLDAEQSLSASRVEIHGGPTCAEQDVWEGTRVQGEPTDSEDARFVCQSTQVAAATLPLRWWNLYQYVEDYTSGNVRATQMLMCVMVFGYEKLVTAGLGLGSPLRWAYDRFQIMRGGTRYPWRTGRVPRGVRTPSARLDLQPGEMIQVRSYAEILETLDETGQNRGMWFDAEMVPYCNGRYRVLRRVNTIIDEKTGRIRRLKNECIQLEGVVCGACYAKYRRFCPRSIYAYWREIWLARAESNGSAGFPGS
jgi:hypothetical protein